VALIPTTNARGCPAIGSRLDRLVPAHVLAMSAGRRGGRDVNTLLLDKTARFT